MRGWLSGLIAAVTGLAGGFGGFMVHASIPIPPTRLAGPPVPATLGQCYRLGDIDENTTAPQVHIVPFSHAFPGKTFSPVTGIILTRGGGTVQIGYLYDSTVPDGLERTPCVSPPLEISGEVTSKARVTGETP